MNAPARMVHAALGLVVAFAGLATSARGEDWPTRPISLVIPFGPGSGTDLVARNIAPPLGEQLGQPLIVQNVGGAGGLIGVTRVAKAELVMGAVDTFALGPSLRKQPPYDPVKDFTTLTPHEFIRRFLMHVLPGGFHRIRHCGLLASGTRAVNIARARQLLAVPTCSQQPDRPETPAPDQPRMLPRPCTCCGGRMFIIETFARGCQPKHRPTPASPTTRIDTS